jgi:hypothetical protein
VDAQNSVCALCGVSLDSPEHASTHATAEKALPLNSYDSRGRRCSATVAVL